MLRTLSPTHSPKNVSNLSANRTACKLRLQVPSALRSPAAGYLKRWASALNDEFAKEDF
jgi:hypothetical protein